MDERQQQDDEVAEQDEAERAKNATDNIDNLLQQAMDSYENNKSMHKNIQNANSEHQNDKIQSILKKDMVRDEINHYIDQYNSKLAYLQTEKQKSAVAVPSAADDKDLEEEILKHSPDKGGNETIAAKQKELFSKNQNIIDNFAKFEDDLFKFEEELTSMINPTVEQELFTGNLSASSSQQKAPSENIDIDKLLADLKKQGEQMLSQQEAAAEKTKGKDNDKKQDHID